MIFDWTAVAVGAGLIVGLTGVGSGSLMTLLLISVFQLEKAVAIGTDLLFAGLSKVSGSMAHHREKQLDDRITALMPVRPMWPKVGNSLPRISAEVKLTKHLPETITRFALCGCLVLAARQVLLGTTDRDQAHLRNITAFF